MLTFDQNNLQFTFSAPVAWRPAQDVAFRYWLSGAARQATHLIDGDPASSAEAVSALSDFIDLPPGRYALHVVPSVDGVQGAEGVYPFSIRSAPPALAVDALNVGVGDAALPRGVTLDATLFDDLRQVRLAFAATDDATSPEGCATSIASARRRSGGAPMVRARPWCWRAARTRSMCARSTPTATVRPPRP